MAEHLDEKDCCKVLWEVIMAFEHYPFRTEDGRKIEYEIDCERLCMGENIFSREEIEKSYHRIRAILQSDGYISKENCWCCEELYTVFLRIGACNRKK